MGCDPQSRQRDCGRPRRCWAAAAAALPPLPPPATDIARHLSPLQPWGPAVHTSALMAAASSVQRFLDEAGVSTKRPAPAAADDGGPKRRLLLPVTLHLEHGAKEVKEARDAPAVGQAAVQDSPAVCLPLPAATRCHRACLPFQRSPSLLPLWAAPPFCSNCCGGWGTPRPCPRWWRAPLRPSTCSSRSSWSERRRECVGGRAVTHTGLLSGCRHRLLLARQASSARPLLTPLILPLAVQAPAQGSGKVC